MTINVGDRFWFRGDWQTDEGEFEVTEVQDMSWGIRCKYVTPGGLFGTDMGWWDQSTVSKLIQETKETA